MLTILRRRIFVNEVLDIAERLGRADPQAGQRFIDACEDTFNQLADMPRLGSPREFNHPNLRNVGMWRVKGYEKYLIFYQAARTTLRLLHLVHGARDYKTLFESE